MWRARRGLRRALNEQHEYVARIQASGVHPGQVVKDVIAGIAACERAIARAGSAATADAWLTAVRAELERELHAWRLREHDEEGYGSATIQEVTRCVTVLAAELER
jgi:hypothetical protein